MLDFLDYLANRLKPETDGSSYWRRAVCLNSEDCRYLLIMQNHQKMFQLDSDVYTGLFNFFGTEGLKIFANYAKRHYEKHSCENKEHEEYILAEKRLNSEEGALLFIDEADSLISDRRSATRSWETTQVNEFLIQLENSKCLVVCSTNFQGKYKPRFARMDSLLGV